MFAAVLCINIFAVTKANAITVTDDFELVDYLKIDRQKANKQRYVYKSYTGYFKSITCKNGDRVRLNTGKDNYDYNCNGKAIPINKYLTLSLLVMLDGQDTFNSLKIMVGNPISKPIFVVDNITYNSIRVSIDNAQIGDYTVSADGKTYGIGYVSDNLSYTVKNLPPNKKLTVCLSIKNEYGTNQYCQDVNTLVIPTPDFSNHHIFVSNITNNSAVINIKSVEPQYTDLYITKDKDVIYETKVQDTADIKYKVTGLLANKTYTYHVYVKHLSGVMSDKIPVTFTTSNHMYEVDNAKASLQDDAVRLDWDMPSMPNLKAVNIYKKSLTDNKGFSLFAVAHADDTHKLIFTTNGDFWIDHTVVQNSKYQYKISTVDTDNKVSNGVLLDIKTPELTIKDPVIDGNKDNKDDFVISWSSPTKGKIKVLVGGKLYKEVDAAVGSITIPYKDMSFNIMGDPDVKLVPVDIDGTEGKTDKPKDVDEITLDIKATDILSIGAGLFWLISAFVLIPLAFLIVPKIINLVRQSVSQRH